jgi:hypothetical protein
MIRWLFILAICCVLAFLGATVPLGKRTFFGHIKNIWASESVKDLKEGIGEKAGPAATRIKKGVEKGLESAVDEGSGSAVAP